MSRLTRRSTDDSSKTFEDDELDVGLFPDVTAMPTRQHWKVCVEFLRGVGEGFVVIPKPST